MQRVTLRRDSPVRRRPSADVARLPVRPSVHRRRLAKGGSHSIGPLQVTAFFIAALTLATACIPAAWEISGLVPIVMVVGSVSSYWLCAYERKHMRRRFIREWSEGVAHLGLPLSLASSSAALVGSHRKDS